MSKYVSQIRTQFNMLNNFYRGMRLDNFLIDEEKMKKAPIFSPPSKEFDDYMFAGIKIKDIELKGMI